MLWLVALFKRIKALYEIINKSAIEKILLNIKNGTGHCYISHIYKYDPSRWCVCVCVWMSDYNTESLSVGHCRVLVREVSRSLDAKKRICRFRNRGGALWLLHKIQSFIPTCLVTVKSH
jgi:hypothetical protein